jgi:putative transposase
VNTTAATARLLRFPQNGCRNSAELLRAVGLIASISECRPLLRFWLSRSASRSSAIPTLVWARALLAKAVEAEVADFLGKHADLKTRDGHRRVVRHGHLPEREVMTGIGPVAIRQPRVRDRGAAAADPDRIRFSPSILPPYMRRSESIETLLPILYLKDVSTGDFSEALSALLGKDAAGLSASAIGRLKEGWLDEHTAWQKRDLSAKRYVHIWADGIHLEAHLENEKQCILVLIGATPEGRKELVGFTDGTRESAHDWLDLLLELKRRGLDVPPQLAIADGALGF